MSYQNALVFFFVFVFFFLTAGPLAETQRLKSKVVSKAGASKRLKERLWQSNDLKDASRLPPRETSERVVYYNVRVCMTCFL